MNKLMTEVLIFKDGTQNVSTIIYDSSGVSQENSEDLIALLNKKNLLGTIRIMEDLTLEEKQNYTSTFRSFAQVLYKAVHIPTLKDVSFLQFNKLINPTVNAKILRDLLNE